jgi:NADP-dependent 3-hydroxy acid dehydrogenase YdfG
MTDKMLSKPTVWITGASSGIGAAIAGSFGTIECTVIVSGKTKNELQKVVQAITSIGGTAYAVLCDVRSEKSVLTAYRTIRKKVGPVDILVNNAGVTAFKSFNDSSIDEFDSIVNVNFRGYFLCTKVVLPEMLQRKQGHIINIHSVAARDTFTQSSVYAGSKAGALAMMRGLRAEVRKQGVRVIDILPGAVETKMWHEGVRKKYHEKMMQPEDVGEVVLSIFLQPGRVTTDEIVIRPVEGDL